MGQKVNPRSFRLGVIESWDSIWFAQGVEYAKYLSEDLKIRKYLKENLYKAGIARVLIRRRANQVEIDIFTARPGLIIGKGGRDVTLVRDTLVKQLGKQVQLNILEEPNPEASAQLVAESVAQQLEKRISHKRAMKQSVTRVLRAHAKGVKIAVSGRLGGSEIARYEWYRMGRVPLHTLRAKIDYGFTEAMTIYGKIGVKVWIYKGEVLPQATAKPTKAEGEVSGGTAA